MEETQAVVDMSPWIGVIGAIIGWTFFLIVIGVLRGFIVGAFSMFLADLIWKASNEDTKEKLARYLMSPEKVIEYLKELEKKSNSS
jgi:hypothetical protein